MQEVKMTIGRDGKVTLHFSGMKAEVRHSLGKELEKLIGPATYRKHGPIDEQHVDHNLKIRDDRG
jgi:hypothetical protein